MADIAWSCPAICIVGKEVLHGVLSLNKSEFLFQHDFVTDIIPINLLTTLASEREEIILPVPLKRKVLYINNANESQPSRFILDESSAETINKHIEQLRNAFLVHEKERKRLLDEERNALITKRNQARVRRQLIRERIRQRHTVQEVIVEEKRKEDIRKECDDTTTSLEKRNHYQRIVDCPNEYLQTLEKKPISSLAHYSNRELVPCISEQEMKELEETLLMNWISPQDVPMMVTLICEVNSGKQKQPKLYLYNQLRRQYGEAIGRQYYHSILRLIDS